MLAGNAKVGRRMLEKVQVVIQLNVKTNIRSRRMRSVTVIRKCRSTHEVRDADV